MHTLRQFVTIVTIVIFVIWFYVHFINVYRFGFYFNQGNKLMPKKMSFQAEIVAKESANVPLKKTAAHAGEEEKTSEDNELKADKSRETKVTDVNDSPHFVSQTNEGKKGTKQKIFVEIVEDKVEKSPLKKLLLKDIILRSDLLQKLEYLSKMIHKDDSLKAAVEPAVDSKENRNAFPKQHLANGRSERKEQKINPTKELGGQRNGGMQQNFAHHLHQGTTPLIHNAKQELTSEQIDIKKVSTNMNQKRIDLKQEFSKHMDMPDQQRSDLTSAPKKAIQKIKYVSCNNCFVHNFRYIINNVNICQKASPMHSVYLFIMIFTSQENFRQREAIRSTWLTYSKQNTGPIRYAFLLGKPLNDSLHKKVLHENFLHNDILKEDFVDSYMNLTYKTIMGFKWVATFCPNAKYILKTDDDMFLNIPNIVNLLQHSGGGLDKVIVGNCYIDAKPIRLNTSKWFASEKLYKEEKYPGYCAGTGYLTSIKVVEKIYKVSPNVPFFHLEDIYVALCLQQIGGTVKRVEGFHSDQPELNACFYKGDSLFTSHWISPETMKQIWESKC